MSVHRNTSATTNRRTALNKDNNVACADAKTFVGYLLIRQPKKELAITTNTKCSPQSVTSDFQYVSMPDPKGSVAIPKIKSKMGKGKRRPYFTSFCSKLFFLVGLQF